MSEYIVNSEVALQSCLGDLREQFRRHKWLKVKTTDGRRRSLNQNDIAAVWYQQIARELPEDDERGWKGYCKLHHAVPILRAEDEDFRSMYDNALKSLTYEQKREVMTILPATSLMTKAQLSKYLEAVQKDFRDHKDVRLEFPKDRAA